MTPRSPGGPDPDAAGSSGVLDLLPDAVLVLQEGPTVVEANRAAESLFGVPREQLVGRSCGEVLDIRDIQGRDACDLLPLGRRLPMVKGSPERDYELTRGNGEWLPVTIRCSYVKDDDGTVRRSVCTIRDARARRGMDMRTVELISTVSHEIRSPLTSIKGFTKTILDRYDSFDDAMKRDMLTEINKDADRVTRLLTELLDVSRLEAGRLKLRMARIDIAHIAERVTGALGPRWEAHQLETWFPEGFPQVVADPDKVQQVLTNLVENALKYTAGGQVRVAGERDGTFVRVSVTDQGEGIAEAQLPRLFRKFYRRERAGSPTGTGLGLYICKGLIEAHGGQMLAASVPGEGSTFAFTLPIKPEVPVE